MSAQHKNDPFYLTDGQSSAEKIHRLLSRAASFDFEEEDLSSRFGGTLTLPGDDSPVGAAFVRSNGSSHSSSARKVRRKLSFEKEMAATVDVLPDSRGGRDSSDSCLSPETLAAFGRMSNDNLPIGFSFFSHFPASPPVSQGDTMIRERRATSPPPVSDQQAALTTSTGLSLDSASSLFGTTLGAQLLDQHSSASADLSSSPGRAYDESSSSTDSNLDSLIGPSLSDLQLHAALRLPDLPADPLLAGGGGAQGRVYPTTYPGKKGFNIKSLSEYRAEATSLAGLDDLPVPQLAQPQKQRPAHSYAHMPRHAHAHARHAGQHAPHFHMQHAHPHAHMHAAAPAFPHALGGQGAAGAGVFHRADLPHVGAPPMDMYPAAFPADPYAPPPMYSHARRPDNRHAHSVSPLKSGSPTHSSAVRMGFCMPPPPSLNRYPAHGPPPPSHHPGAYAQQQSDGFLAPSHALHSKPGSRGLEGGSYSHRRANSSPNNIDLQAHDAAVNGWHGGGMYLCPPMPLADASAVKRPPAAAHPSRKAKIRSQSATAPSSPHKMCEFALNTFQPHLPYGVEDQRREELNESPNTKVQFKAFFKQFKQKEKEGLEAATEFANSHFEILPKKVHWKVYLEMADLAKRENHIERAVQYYEMVNKLQPYAYQGWLEFAKMEEECGSLNKCKKILQQGLAFCPYNEGLLVKAIKHEERMDNLEGARQLLARLKHVGIDKSWKTMMEGAQLEARAGNLGVARKIFKYLMKNVPWYGPIYQEAYRFEEKCENFKRCILVISKGIEENSRYGPLWFSALRLYEKVYGKNLAPVRDLVEKASKAVSKELTWKLFFEAAQVEERAGNLAAARASYVQSIRSCPDNLLWKIWLGGARTELGCGNVDTARKLQQRALELVPPKMKAMVYLEISKLEEFTGHVDRARKVLKTARKETKHEWKVFLETVLLEMRNSSMEEAMVHAQNALRVHTGTGRLWAVMIQLQESAGVDAQETVFKQALKGVPKSGEVWCEGARLQLPRKRYDKARQFLEFAIRFTPQYGDSFVEFLRLRFLTEGPNANTEDLERWCVNADPNYGALWLFCKRHPLDTTRQVLRVVKALLLLELFPELNSPYLRQVASVVMDGCDKPPTLTLSKLTQNIAALPDSSRRIAIFGPDHIKP